MDINQLFDVNVSRANRWHPGGIEEWSALEWAGAMAGESGEAANAAKKLKRLECSIASLNDEGRHFATIAEAKIEVAKEVADTILYGLLLMARIGVTDPSQTIRAVFNKKSEEYDFPERM
jgi:NTP pyrophosphatase (non-canonical NTP hydrolase)